MSDAVCFGYNRTDCADVLWVPVVKSAFGPLYEQRDVYGRVTKQVQLKDWLEHLVKNQTRLCRIWIKYEDGTEKCVFWYEQGELTL